MEQKYPRRLARLKALADKLEKDYDDAPVTVRAQIAAQFRQTLTDIAVLEPEEPEPTTEVDPIEAIRARREAAGRG